MRQRKMKQQKMKQQKMKQQKMKQRKSKQSKSLAKILTLGIAAATVVSSMSVPGGLLAPETVYASDNTGTAESGDQGTAPQEETIQFDVSIRPNDSATVYVCLLYTSEPEQIVIPNSITFTGTIIDNVIESLVPIILVDVEENSGLSYDKVLFELTEEQKIGN